MVYLVDRKKYYPDEPRGSINHVTCYIEADNEGCCVIRWMHTGKPILYQMAPII
jgi:hypothetical protein